MGRGIAIVGVILVLGVFTTAAFLLLGAKIAGIRDRTFGGAIGIAILGGIPSAFLNGILSVVGVLGMILGFIGAFLVYALVELTRFGDSFG